MSSRPRAPGRNRALGERLRSSRQEVVLGGLVAVAALLVAGTLGVLAWNARSAPVGQPEAGSAGSPRPTPLALPLDIADTGFDGTIADVDADEGPGATSFCNNNPAVDGLTDWSGQVFTERGNRRRVVQILARFRSSVDAAAYLAQFTMSNSEVVNCETWNAAGADGPVTFTVVDGDSVESYGDEAQRFDLTASTDGSDLFLRLLFARSGRDVLQITYVSANRQDLEDTARLLGVAGENGWF